jgi:enoyl-CoA hydratase
VVAAVEGVAVGAGLALALAADVAVVGKKARLLDGHLRLGVAAGDHAVLLWPLLVGMAKAKYHLFLNEPLSGEEAERLGLVALAVEEGEVYARALEVAERLAQGPKEALEPHQAGPQPLATAPSCPSLSSPWPWSSWAFRRRRSWRRA